MRGTGHTDTRRIRGSNVGGRVMGVQIARDAAIVAGVKTGGGTGSVSPPARDNLQLRQDTRSVGILPIGVCQ